MEFWRARQFLGFYDVHRDCLEGIFSKHKRVVDICQALEPLRKCYPRRRLYVLLDNLHNVHDHPTVLALMRQLRINPVWTPTDAWWLNLIEAQFGVLKRLTLANTDDLSHTIRRRRIYRYLKLSPSGS